MHGSPVLLIVTHAERDSCALYLMDCRAWPIFRELLGCSIPCLREHPVIIVFEPAAFSRPVPSALAAAHTYRRICQVPCALPERPFRLACQPLCCSSGPARHEYFRCGKGTRLGFEVSIGIKRFDQRGCSAGQNNKWTKTAEACARKIARSEGKDWDSMWTLTQDSSSYRDEAETVCHSCYVGGSAPQIQKDAFHNFLTGAVRHWMGEDYWGN